MSKRSVRKLRQQGKPVLTFKERVHQGMLGDKLEVEKKSNVPDELEVHEHVHGEHCNH